MLSSSSAYVDPHFFIKSSRSGSDFISLTVRNQLSEDPQPTLLSSSESSDSLKEHFEL